MIKSKNRVLIIFIALLLLFGQAGCSSPNQYSQFENGPIPVDDTLNRLKVVIIPVDNTPHIECIAYDKGRGRAAAKGAEELGKQGAIGGALFPVHALLEGGGDPLGQAAILVLLPVLIPACALGGAVIGSSAGAIGGAVAGDYKEMPMNTVVELEDLSKNLAAMTNLNKPLAGHLLIKGHALTNNNYSVKNSIDQNNDVDVILKVNITKLLFKGEIESDPDISFEMSVNVEVTDATESIYFSDRFDCTSNQIELSDWIKHKGQPLQEEFDRCYRAISGKILKDLFILN